MEINGMECEVVLVSRRNPDRVTSIATEAELIRCTDVHEKLVDEGSITATFIQANFNSGSAIWAKNSKGEWGWD